MPAVTRTTPVTASLPAATPAETTAEPTSGPGTVTQPGSLLQIAGPVYGTRGTGGNYIDLITFDLVKIPRVDPVDMENVQVTLKRYFQTTGLRFEITGRTNANGDSILEEGETFAISVYVKPDFSLYPNDRFELRVLAPASSAILVQSQVPASLEQQNLLAEP
jgi:archaellin